MSLVIGPLLSISVVVPPSLPPDRGPCSLPLHVMLLLVATDWCGWWWWRGSGTRSRRKKKEGEGEREGGGEGEAGNTVLEWSGVKWSGVEWSGRRKEGNGHSETKEERATTIIHHGKYPQDEKNLLRE